MRILLLEEVSRAGRQFKKGRALFQVVLVRLLVKFDIAQASSLFLTHFLRELRKEMSVDAIIELVDVHRMDTVLEAFVFPFEPRECRVMLLTLVGVAFLQGLAKPRQHPIAEAKTLHDLLEPLLQHLLADIRLGAPTFEAGAMVINVAALLDLADHCTATMTTTDKTLERELVTAVPDFGSAAPVEDALNALP